MKIKHTLALKLQGNIESKNSSDCSHEVLHIEELFRLVFCTLHTIQR